MNKEERQIVVPGETIVKGNEFLPGEGAYRDGGDIVANRFGIVDIADKHVRVIAVSGAYYPRRGNTIIGTVVDITFNGWLIDFGGAQNAFLSVAEVPRYINKNELVLELQESDMEHLIKFGNAISQGLNVRKIIHHHKEKRFYTL